MFHLMNENVMAREDACEVINSSLRKVYHVITGPPLSAGPKSSSGNNLNKELLPLKDLQSKFLERIDFIMKAYKFLHISIPEVNANSAT